MTPPSPKALSIVASDGSGLRLNFIRIGDRYGHTIQVILKDRLFPLLASADCCDESSWPASPPLQHLAVEDREDHSVALLVGMAGHSHWSASVETSRDPTGFTFDIACRIKDRPERLGSEYRAMTAPRWSADQRCVELPTAAGICRVEPLTVEKLEPAPLMPTAEGFLIEAPWADASPPATVRWRYRIGLEA